VSTWTSNRRMGNTV